MSTGIKPDAGFKRLVYISSPFKPVATDSRVRREEVKLNYALVKTGCEIACSRGCIPIAPHLMFPTFLNDNMPQEREIAVKMALELVEHVDELWVLGDRISEGMAKEINKASELKIPIKVIESPETGEDKLMRVILGCRYQSELDRAREDYRASLVKSKEGKEQGHE